MDNPKWDGVVSQLKTQAEEHIAQSPTPASGQPPAVNLQQANDIERLASRLISYPYGKIADTTGFDHFRLDPDEELINAILVKNVVLFYLPFINLGKLSLWCFIGFNGLMIAVKSMEYRAYMKQIQEAEKKREAETKKVEPKPESKSEPKPEPKSESV